MSRTHRGFDRGRYRIEKTGVMALALGARHGLLGVVWLNEAGSRGYGYECER